jgi:hypothetical protein
MRFSISQGYGVYMFFATMTMLSIPYLYFLLPETENVPLYIKTSPINFFHSEEMDCLFGPHLWKANKVVMEDVCTAHGSNVYTDALSINSEGKAVGSVEHREQANVNDVTV